MTVSADTQHHQVDAAGPGDSQFVTQSFRRGIARQPVGEVGTRRIDVDVPEQHLAHIGVI